MRHTDQLKDLEFTPSKVKVTDWDLRIPITPKAGPYCQLHVDAAVASAPGVFAWVVGDKVVYVGDSDDLSLVAHDRGDFTSVTQSTTDSGAAKVNNLLNAAFKDEYRISFWWRQELTADDAAKAAATLVAEFDPMGNQLARRAASPAPAEPAKKVAAPKARAAAADKPQKKVGTRYDPERVVPKNLVCPSCFIQVPLSTAWCDDCEIKVGG